MKSLKLKLLEYRIGLKDEQSEVDAIVSEHINLCDSYSEHEIFNSLSSTLNQYSFYDSVPVLLESIDSELKNNTLLYNLKDLYAKINRMPNGFLYESALTTLIECINVTNDEDRKIKILNDLKMYEWIFEVKMFLSELATNPQTKQNYLSKGGKIDDVFSIVLEVNAGEYATYIAEKWFLMNDQGIGATLLENHINDQDTLRKIRTLEDAMKRSKITENHITFKIAEELTVTFETDTKKIFLNGDEADKDATLETLFNSPLIPFMGKAYYPILKETYNNLDKFMKVDTVKHIYNIGNAAFECFVFNYKGKLAQYRIDRHIGESYRTFDNALPLIENVMHELGADITFFFESVLDGELKKRTDLEKQERVLMEKLTDVENAIIAIKNEGIILKESTQVQKVYNGLLSKRHQISEQIKIVKNEKIKFI